MKTTNQKLLSWAIEKIKKDYNDDICLLIGNNGILKLEQDADASSFDYFVPANEKAYNLAKTFIIDGIGYDLYPRSWERIEYMADLNDYNTNCLGDAVILYYRSEEDKERFIAMQDKLKKNLENREFMFSKALEKLEVAMGIYQTMMFEENIGKVRVAAGYIADFLSVSVAFINQTYFKYTQIEQIAELSAMKDIPENFIEFYRAVIEAGSVDHLKKISHAMILTTRKFLNSRKPVKANIVSGANFNNLTDWYHELCYTWRRIYHWCDQGDAQKVFIWGCMLQNELNTVKEEFGLIEMDLMSIYNAGYLSDIKRQAEKLEQYIVGEIKLHGVALNKYDTIDEFIAANS